MSLTAEVSALGRRRLNPLSALRALWARKTWLSTVHVLLDLPIGLVTFTASFVLLMLTVGMAITAIFAVITAWLLFVLTRVFTSMERSRFRGILGVEILPARRRTEPTWWSRFLGDIRSASTWRQVAYHHLLFITGLIGFVLVTVVWSVGLVCSTLPLHGWTLPEEGLLDRDWSEPWQPHVVALTLVGWVVLLGAPWLARMAALIDIALAQRLLGPSRNEELSARVETLTESRAGVVDAADAERRRIERNLHDGTQQRLVSLAMNLGMARARSSSAPTPAREAIEQAHEEAKAALVELRDFIRGLHPAVLNDRGLDAALSGLAARTPIPVRLQVDIPNRASATIEAVAYFVVSEALANVVKHAKAQRVGISVRRVDDRLHVAITDDGQGGASLGNGSGLRGLAQRVASVDGTLLIDSPPGGPTVITVELPCES